VEWAQKINNTKGDFWLLQAFLVGERDILISNRHDEAHRNLSLLLAEARAHEFGCYTSYSSYNHM